MLGAEEVLVGVFDAAGKQQRVASAFDKDGGVWWKQEIHAGQPTFEQVYLANRCVGGRVVCFGVGVRGGLGLGLKRRRGCFFLVFSLNQPPHPPSSTINTIDDDQGRGRGGHRGQVPGGAPRPPRGAQGAVSTHTCVGFLVGWFWGV